MAGSPLQSGRRQALVPAVVVSSVWLLSWVVYNTIWRAGVPALTKTGGFVSGAAMFAVLAAGPLITYFWAGVRGAGPKSRILASLAPYIMWNLKEIIRVTEFFPLIPALFYTINPLALGILAASAAEMGLAEMVLRWRVNQKPVLSLNLAGVILGGGMGTFVFLFWGMGVHWLYVYMKMYRLLFN
jgi:hypothetical protein